MEGAQALPNRLHPAAGLGAGERVPLLTATWPGVAASRRPHTLCLSERQVKICSEPKDEVEERS